MRDGDCGVMMTGCSLALTPLLLVVLAEIKIIPPLPDWATTTCFLMLMFFPITMAYVIVVQRAMDVRMVIRSGVALCDGEHRPEDRANRSAAAGS